VTGIEGQAGQIDAVTLILQSKARQVPDPTDLLGILPFEILVTVNGRVVHITKLDVMTFTWTRRALILTQPIAPAVQIGEADELLAFLQRPPDTEPHNVTKAGLIIMAGVESSTAKNTELGDFLQILREATDDET
jgi:hypothetical protein